MKGAVFVALSDMITEQHGIAVWHKVLDDAGEDGVYTGTMNYDDERIYKLVGAICENFNLEVADTLRAFGEYLFGALHASAPVFAESKTNFLDFIDSIGSVIHLEVFKLDDQARPPYIEVINRTDSTADLVYRSDRKLCFLAEGLLNGAAAHYGVAIQIAQPECMHNGAESCLLRISLGG